MRRWQERRVFRRLGIQVGKDAGGYAAYLAAYQVLTSAAAIRGYAQFVAESARRWR